jgi:hypothetical protein
MKTSLGLFCLLALCLVATSFQSSRWAARALPDWVTCQVDNQFSVQLPVQPTEMDMLKVFTSQGVKLSAEQLEKVKGMRILTATDGVANYMITLTALGAEVGIDTPGNRASYYDGAINGILRNERGTLLQRSVFTINGAEGVQVSYRGVHKGTGKMVVKYNRMLAVDKSMYILAVYPVDRTDSTGVNLKEQRTRFFTSIAYKPSPKPSK